MRSMEVSRGLIDDGIHKMAEAGSALRYLTALRSSTARAERGLKSHSKCSG